MRKSSRLLLSILAASALSSSLGCYVREREHRYDRDRYGRAYRHARWHGEDVYQLEDDRWYAWREGQWVLVPEAEIEIEIH